MMNRKINPKNDRQGLPNVRLVRTLCRTSDPTRVAPTESNHEQR